MRTTIDIDDNLFQSTKQRAIEQKTTVKKLVEDALRSFLAKPTTLTSLQPIRLVTFSGSGTKPGVDLSDNSQVMDIMDDI